MNKLIYISLAFISLVFSLRATEAQRPNIIWLMSEDMGIDLECYGMPGVKTPHLNQLAAEGALYTRAYALNPICSPSRSSMMVGVHPTVINAQHHRSNEDVPLVSPYKPITHYLRKAGYTCLIGHEKVYSMGLKTDCNFKHERVGAYDGVKEFGLFDREGAFTAEDQPFFSQIQLKVTHRGDWWNDIRKKSEHPVQLEDVELPPYYVDTPEIRYDWAAYLDTVEYMDNEVGILMQDLKDKGLAGNTIVIFIADNGRCNIRGKGFLYEAGIHVPMIVWAPGLIEAGTVIDELVTTTDISASILKLAGASKPEYITANPIIGVDNPVYRDYVYASRDIWGEIDECSRSITTKRFKYIKNHMPEVPWSVDHAYSELNRPALHVMRVLKAKGELSEFEMTYFQDTKPVEELYDLDNDPFEMNNLAQNPEYAKVLEELRGHQLEWQAANFDHGLADIGKREPVVGSTVTVRANVKRDEPDLWKRLESGELMQTQQWMKEFK
ncbi:MULTISPECIES: sulfatase [unclassified Lentimonas]|uniref:sulfatase family protein n=1 Tax=unclassified Lentimonas TaxID=2630993 RepID=UPI001FCF9E92|nr:MULTISPECIES: sulfatase [unclassified Lentimonas]